MTEKHATSSEIESFVYDIEQNAELCSIEPDEFAEFLSPLFEEGEGDVLLRLTSCSLALAFELSIQTAVIEREHYRALAEMQQAAEEVGYTSGRKVNHSEELGGMSIWHEPSQDKSIGRLL